MGELFVLQTPALKLFPCIDTIYVRFVKVYVSIKNPQELWACVGRKIAFVASYFTFEAIEEQEKGEIQYLVLVLVYIDLLLTFEHSK